MKKSKNYEGVRFSRATLAAALEALGSRRLSQAEVELMGETTWFETEDAFLASYASSAKSRAWISTKSSSTSLVMHAFPTEARVTIESNDDVVAARVLTVLDQARIASAASGAPTPTEIARFCVPAALNWKSLLHISDFVAKHGIVIRRLSVHLKRYPENTTYDAWAPAIDDVSKHGEPRRYSIRMHGTDPFTLGIQRDTFSNSDEYYLRVEVTGPPTASFADEFIGFLGLRRDAAPSPDAPKRSAFVAHRFDDEGAQASLRLTRFLELLGFLVKTGAAFSPESVAQKVRRRIEEQAFIFVVLTPGEDATWLTQESIVAYARDKKLFVLRDRRFHLKAGLLGDMEHIPFDGGQIEQAFIPVLEGLQELGLLPKKQP